MAAQNSNGKPFLTDVKTLRDRVRKHMDMGAVTPSYQGDVSKTIEILQTVLATEIVCEDPGTRAMLEGILVVEEEHANDMSDLLVAHEDPSMTSN